MEKAVISEKTISYGKQSYRVNSEYEWLTLMFGTFGPEDNGIPRYAWRPIPENRVPDSVKKLVKR